MTERVDFVGFVGFLPRQIFSLTRAYMRVRVLSERNKLTKPT